MLTKVLAASLCLASLVALQPAHAADSSCSIKFAVSTPPIQLDQNVAFNIASEGPTTARRISRMITLSGGNPPQILERLQCSIYPYVISATAYFTSLNKSKRNRPAMGECVLKRGSILLNNSYNSVSVVFPNDFVCN